MHRFIFPSSEIEDKNYGEGKIGTLGWWLLE